MGFLTLVFLFFTSYSQEKLQYTIISNNNKIGTLTAEKSVANNVTTYKVNSNSKMKIFLTVDYSYTLNCTYKKDTLLYSSITTYLNGRQWNKATTDKISSNIYKTTNDNHENKLFIPITYSGTLLYFKEPNTVTNVYSEIFTDFNPIKKIDNHIYQLTNSKNGNTNKYFYANGILQKAIIQHKLMTIELQLIH